MLECLFTKSSCYNLFHEKISNIPCHVTRVCKKLNPDKLSFHNFFVFNISINHFHIRDFFQRQEVIKGWMQRHSFSRRFCRGCFQKHDAIYFLPILSNKRYIIFQDSLLMGFNYQNLLINKIKFVKGITDIGDDDINEVLKEDGFQETFSD